MALGVNLVFYTLATLANAVVVMPCSKRTLGLRAGQHHSGVVQS
ncbi:MAG: hypothetical protein Q9O62_06710 [Ardenticatenia bacterium]|nr:hypothetical protein [Ardenticatenia bacterium]